MPEHGVPLLALALAAAARSYLQLGDDPEAGLRIAFTDAVAEMDNADRAYRAAIEQTLPHQTARTMLSAMAAFRECAHQVREAAMREMREIYARNNRPWDWLDPLDVHAAPPRGLSHADATRISALGDRARSQVDTLRAQANESVAKELTEEQALTLRGAKVRRRDAFTRIVGETLRRSQWEDDKAAGRLAELADGWY